MSSSTRTVWTPTSQVGDLFQYEIKNPVTVKRGQSALVPIVLAHVEGRRVAVFNPEIRAKNPMSAVLLKNTSGATLEGGPMTVLEEGSYVGALGLVCSRAVLGIEGHGDVHAYDRMRYDRLRERLGPECRRRVRTPAATTC